MRKILQIPCVVLLAVMAFQFTAKAEKPKTCDVPILTIKKIEDKKTEEDPPKVEMIVTGCKYKVVHKDGTSVEGGFEKEIIQVDSLFLDPMERITEIHKRILEIECKKHGCEKND